MLQSKRRSTSQQQQQPQSAANRKHTIQETIKVYTDWTNHYLDKSCAKRRVTDLQKDVADGVLLADVIEAVTNQKVSDINRKPKSSSQMIDNIRACLSALIAFGVQLDGISAKDVRDGNLKAILGLFFSLSRHKQQQKQLKLQAQQEHDMPSRLPSPYQKTNGSSIPTPASARRAPEKRAGPPPLHQPPGVPNLISSNGSHQQSGGAHSFIPTPHSGPREKLHHPNNLGRITPPTSSSATPSAAGVRVPSKGGGGNAHHGDAKNNNNNNNNSSMLDKLKLFNGKEKQTRNKPGSGGCAGGASNGGISKRTSSSSGFSSARSERSDSSTSLYCEINPKQNPSENKSNSHEESKQHSTSNPRPVRNRLTKQTTTTTNVSKTQRKQQPPVSNTEKERIEGEGRPEQATIQEIGQPHSPLKQQNNEQNSNNTGIPKPTATVKGVSKPVNRSRQTVALVSPMPSEMSESSQSNSTGQSSESSSVIYRPSSDSGGSDVSPAKHNASPIKCISPTPTSTSIIKMPATTKIETTFDTMDKVITKESILEETLAKTTNFIVKEDEVTNCLPMQPLLRGYTRTRASLMHQGLRNDVDSKHHIRNLHDSIVHLKRGHADGSYSDDYTNIDIAAGYMSDCGGIGGHGYPIMENGGLKSVQEVFDAGYLSEGGASPYARRLHQLSQRAHLNGSVDISSKLHSTDDHGGPHSQKRITRTSVSGTINGGLGGGGGGKYGKVLNVHHETPPPPPPPGQPPPPPPPGHPHHVIYRSHHQRPSNKIDSDHLNEMHPPPYRLPPGGNCWPDHSTNTSAARMPELQRGKSDLELIRSKRHHHHHASSTTPASSPSSQQLHQQHSSTSAGSPQQQNMNGAMSARTRLERSRKIGSGSKDDICNGSSEKGRVPPPAPAPNGHSQPPSPAPAGNLPLRNGDSHGKSTSKVRGVPQSFGYVKRSGGSTTSGPVGSSGPNNKNEPRTAQVTAVPRTKVKVSGGTQTCTSDLHQHKSYSLTGPAAGQLSQGVRERLLLGSHSLPKPAALQRPYRPSDGSLSDTVYSDLQSYYTSSPYSNWLRYSAAYTSSLPSRASAGGLVEADSMESLSSLPAQLQHRASLTHARLLMHQRENSGSPVPRLSRSNSIRSTKSEKLYPSMLQRSDEQDPYYGIPIMPVVPTAASSALSQSHHSSQPTSPTPSQSTAASRYNSSMSPIASSASSYGLSRTSMSIFSGLLGGKTSSKDDDVHGSSASLVSTASSLYSTPEEKQAHEIRKLKRELLDAQEKVHTLTSQLSTNAHVVSAFEQSLSNMTQRLQHLTSTAERKDSELLELRQTIELLRKQSVEAGLTSAHLQNMSPLLSRRNFDGNTITPAQASMARQLSADSVSSLNSLSSACSLGSSQHTPSTGSGKKKKKGWLRSSFSRAFSRSKKNKNGSVSDVEDSRGLHSDISAPSSPLLSGVPHHPHLNGGNGSNPNETNAGLNGINGLKTSQSSSAIYQKDAEVGPEVVEELKKQLREKDLVLTDIRLEALSSAHQLESLKDTVIKMRNEMLNLKQDNERLQRIVTSKSLTSSQSSLQRTESLERRLSMTEPPTSALFCADGLSTSGDDSRKLLVSVLLGSHGSYQKYLEEGEGPDGSPPEAVISAVLISTKTSWDLLDCIVRRTFKDYISRVDSASSLGLSVESIWSYHVGEMVRYSDGPTPELLPHGYLDPGDSGNVRVCLKGALHGGCVDALAFETLIPKSILQRYICLLTEHRRIILCGPSGTGKSYIANKLAEFLVLRDGKESTAESIATFNVDHKSSKELRQYLANLAEQCESNAADLPSVIILDQLHHASSLGEVFNGFLNAKYNKCPYIIGTMNQATCSTTNLQLHHNFRWVLCANHMEPVKGFLGRYLRRRLIETEARSGVRHAELTRVIEWMSKVWHHLNKFLETHSSSDVTIGPRLFLSCPTDITGSQVWFTDLWNYSVVPYLMEAVREGLQLYGRRAPWEDPAEFICQTYPWPLHSTSGGPELLLRLRPEDVGYNTQTHGSGGTGIGGGPGSVKSLGSAQSDTEGDPLLNMLMRLQEAANYSSPPSNDSDLSGSLSDAGSRVESTL